MGGRTCNAFHSNFMHYQCRHLEVARTHLAKQTTRLATPQRTPHHPIRMCVCVCSYRAPPGVLLVLEATLMCDLNITRIYILYNKMEVSRYIRTVFCTITPLLHHSSHTSHLPHSPSVRLC